MKLGFLTNRAHLLPHLVIRLAIGLVILLVMGLSGCEGCSDEPAPVQTGTSELACLESDDESCVQPYVTRLTPEQISNRIGDAFGHRLTYLDDEGYIYDEVVTGFGVPLGGLDFMTSDTRDPTIKVSTLLVAHAVAWLAANEIVWMDLDYAAENGEHLLFTQCDPEWDTPKPIDPDSAEEDEHLQRAERWRAQLDSLVWRAFSRPPTEAEATLYADLFYEVALEENELDLEDPFIRAWMALIYTMLSTVEFWTV